MHTQCIYLRNLQTRHHIELAHSKYTPIHTHTHVLCAQTASDRINVDLPLPGTMHRNKLALTFSLRVHVVFGEYMSVVHAAINSTQSRPGVRGYSWCAASRRTSIWIRDSFACSHTLFFFNFIRIAPERETEMGNPYQIYLDVLRVYTMCIGECHEISGFSICVSRRW